MHKLIEDTYTQALRIAVHSSVEWMVGQLEAFEGNEDMTEAIRRALRDQENKEREEERRAMRAKLKDVFEMLDTDGSRMLDHAEVRIGLQTIGVVFEEVVLSELFGVVCVQDGDQGEGVTLDGLDFLLRVLACEHKATDAHFAVDVDVVVKALEAPKQSTRCTAAQKMCSLARHADVSICMRRQNFIAEIGGIGALLRCVLGTEDANLQFWCALAMTKVCVRSCSSA